MFKLKRKKAAKHDNTTTESKETSKVVADINVLFDRASENEGQTKKQQKQQQHHHQQITRRKKQSDLQFIIIGSCSAVTSVVY